MKKSLLRLCMAVLCLFGTLSVVQPVAASALSVEQSVSLSGSLYHMIHHTIGDDDYLIVAAGENGVYLYKLTADGIATTPTATIDTTGTAVDVAAYGDMLYIADKKTGSGLQQEGHVFGYSLANPASPTAVFDFDVPFISFQSVATSADGTVLYAGSSAGLYALDVATNPSIPAELSVSEEGAGAVNIVIEGDSLFMLQVFDNAEYSTVEVFNVADPTAPSLISENSVNVSANEMELRDGNMLFVANGSAGVTMYDYSNLSNPSELGTLDTPGTSKSVSSISDTSGVTADGSGGVHLITYGSDAAINATNNTDVTSAVDTVVFDGRVFVLSSGIHELSVSYEFAATGSKSGAEEMVTVTESGNEWCTISVSDSKVGAQVFVADVDGDGEAQEIVEAPKDKVKKAKVRVYDAMNNCELVSQKKMDDSDKKRKYIISAGNYYGSETSKDEIVATRGFEKDGAFKTELHAFFLNDSDALKLKVKKSFEVAKTMVEDGYTVAVKEGKSYPVVLKAKADSNLKAKFQLKKTDGEFKWAQKAE